MDCIPAPNFEKLSVTSYRLLDSLFCSNQTWEFELRLERCFHTCSTTSLQPEVNLIIISAESSIIVHCRPLQSNSKEKQYFHFTHKFRIGFLKTKSILDVDTVRL